MPKITVEKLNAFVALARAKSLGILASNTTTTVVTPSKATKKEVHEKKITAAIKGMTNLCSGGKNDVRDLLNVVLGYELGDVGRGRNGSSRGYGTIGEHYVEGEVIVTTTQKDGYKKLTPVVVGPFNDSDGSTYGSCGKSDGKGTSNYELTGSSTRRATETEINWFYDVLTLMVTQSGVISAKSFPSVTQ